MDTHFQFTDPTGYAYRPGMIFLGLDLRTGREIGIDTERHLFTAAGSRSGKGACLIIPNLKRWTKATLVIDPKGENCEETWQDRERMGHVVRALDPFNEADIPGHIRGYFNPLDGIEPDGPRAREQVKSLASGMVVVADPKHAEWAKGAASIIAGAIAFTIATAEPALRNLSTARGLLKQTPENLKSIARLMMDCDACGGLGQTAGTIIHAAVTSTSGMPPQLLDAAQRSTEWLDAPQVAQCLSKSNFDIGDLKTDKLSLYLILPPEEIKEYSALFRMIVQVSLKAMMTGGRKAKGECLFILDEFASLGRLDLVEEASGRMPGYGVHLWPFVQQIGQLQKLYDKEGAETFLGNADAHIYFGPQDTLTPEYISVRSGRFKPREVAGDVPSAPFTMHHKPDDSFTAGMNSWAQQSYQDSMNRYNDAMRLAGTPRLTPSEIIALTGKGNNDKVARSMIVFAKAGDVLNLKLMPYFYNSSQSLQDASSASTQETRKWHDLSPTEWIKSYTKYTISRILNPPNTAVLKETLIIGGFSFAFAYIALFFAGVWAVYKYVDGKVPIGWKIDNQSILNILQHPIVYLTSFAVMVMCLIMYHWTMLRIGVLGELAREAEDVGNELLAEKYRKKRESHAKRVRLIFADFYP